MTFVSLLRDLREEIAVQGAWRKALTLEAVALPESLPPAQAVSHVAAALGCNEIAWSQCTAEQAAESIRTFLARGLAYGEETMPVEVAERFASRFIALLGKDATYFRNHVLEGQRIGAWSPVSSATFDAAVAGVNSSHGALAWVEDED